MYEDLAAAMAQQAPETGPATVNPLMLAKALRQRAGKVDAVPDAAQTWGQVAGRMGDTIQQTFGGMDVRDPESVTPEGIAGIVGALGPQVINMLTLEQIAKNRAAQAARIEAENAAMGPRKTSLELAKERIAARDRMRAKGVGPMDGNDAIDLHDLHDR